MYSEAIIAIVLILGSILSLKTPLKVFREERNWKDIGDPFWGMIILGIGALIIGVIFLAKFIVNLLT